MWLDIKSLLGYACTVFFGWLGHVSKNDIATTVAILAGISTIIYNSINIYLKIKKK